MNMNFSQSFLKIFSMLLSIRVPFMLFNQAPLPSPSKEMHQRLAY